MGTPDTSAGIGVPNSLVENLVYQGDLLNQPEVYWETGEFYGLMNTAICEVYGDYDFDIVSTEIARRTSLLAQRIDKAMKSQVGLVATPSWKQGTMRQGGPADTFLRRFVLPEGYGRGVPAGRQRRCGHSDGHSGLRRRLTRTAGAAHDGNDADGLPTTGPGPHAVTGITTACKPVLPDGPSAQHLGH